MTLTELERHVIRLGFSPGEPPIILFDLPIRRRDRIGRLMFGHRPATPLADRRLEGLRAMAAAVRDHPKDPDPEMVALFMASGWSSAYLSIIQEMAAARWGEPEARNSRSLMNWIFIRRTRRGISGGKYAAAVLRSVAEPMVSDQPALPARASCAGSWSPKRETAFAPQFWRWRSSVRA